MLDSLDQNCLQELLETLTTNLIAKSAPLITFMVSLSLFGIVGNGLVILVYQRKKSKTTANIFMLNLAWLDGLCCLLLHPYAIFKLCHPLDQGWTTVCKVFEFLVHTAFSASVCLLTVMAIDRYLAVCRALDFVRSQRLSYVMSGISFAVGCFGSLPVLEFYGQAHNNISDDSLGLSMTYVRCDISDTYILSQQIFWYSRAEFIMFVICLAIITVSYLLVALKLAKRKIVGTIETPLEAPSINLSRKEANPTSRHPSDYELSKRAAEIWASRSHRSEETAAQDSTTEGRQRLNTTDSIGQGRRHRGISRRKPTGTLRVYMMLVVITVAFLLSWLPLFFVKFGVMENKVDSLASRLGRNFLQHTFYLNNVINPFIYLVFQKLFRTDICSIMKRCYSRT